MRFSFRTLVIAMVGITAFENGMHNVLLHSDAGFVLTWFSLAFGSVLLLVLARDIVIARKKSMAGRSKIPGPKRAAAQSTGNSAENDA